MFLQGQRQRKAVVLGRRQNGLFLSRWTLEEPPPGNTAQPSPDAGSATLLEQSLSLKSLCRSRFQEPPPFSAIPAGPAMGGGGGLCTNPSSFSTVAALYVSRSRGAALWASFLPLSLEHPRTPLPTPPHHPPQLQAPWSLLAASAPPWEMAKGQPIRVRVKLFQKESEAQRG